MVVKDKDLVLLNATVIDTVVPIGQMVVHINCIAHAIMHVERCVTGSLDQRDGLRFCLKWLKRIDEVNKVCVLLCSAQPTHLNIVACDPRHAHSVVPGPLRLALLCTAHTLKHCRL
jgi:hypothetical protein